MSQVNLVYLVLERQDHPGFNDPAYRERLRFAGDGGSRSASVPAANVAKTIDLREGVLVSRPHQTWMFPNVRMDVRLSQVSLPMFGQIMVGQHWTIKTKAGHPPSTGATQMNGRSTK